MDRKKLAYFLLIASVVLLIINFYEIGLENIFSLKIFNPLSNILLIVAMALTIRDINKKKSN